MNREQRRQLTVAQLKDHAAALQQKAVELETEAKTKHGVAYSPLAVFEIAIDTLADQMFGEGTRRRVEFDIAKWERVGQLFDEETIVQRKAEALAEIEKQNTRNKLLDGVNLGEKEARAVLQVPNQ